MRTVKNDSKSIQQLRKQLLTLQSRQDATRRELKSALKKADSIAKKMLAEKKRARKLKKTHKRHD